jgi:FMN reductase
MVAAAPVHALAVEVHLRPLLVELGATVATRGLCVLESQPDDLDAVVRPWAATAAPALRALLSRAGAT